MLVEQNYIFGVIRRQQSKLINAGVENGTFSRFRYKYWRHWNVVSRDENGRDFFPLLNGIIRRSDFHQRGNFRVHGSRDSYSVLMPLVFLIDETTDDGQSCYPQWDS